MTRVLYPGSFDPVHNGHVEMVETAAGLFDEVVVAALINPSKDDAMFDLEERMALLDESFAHLSNVRTTMFDGLVVDLAGEVEADFIIKGLRAVSDFESELQMAQMNTAISGVQTLFLPTASRRSFMASRLIREVARLGGDVSQMVPDPVRVGLQDRVVAGPIRARGHHPFRRWRPSRRRYPRPPLRIPTGRRRSRRSSANSGRSLPTHVPCRSRPPRWSTRRNSSA